MSTPLLALRLAVCNDRWAEMWSKALAYRERQSVLLAPLTPPVQPPSRPREASHTPSSPAPKAASASRSRVQAEDSRHPASVRPRAQRTSAPPDAEKSTAAAAVCRSCGVPVVCVLGHRRRQYCSDTCRMRAYRARHTRSFPRRPLAERIKHEGVKRLPRTRIQRPRPSRAPCQPFVKQRADCCPCGTPVVGVPGRGHRPRLYCSARCRMRALRWRRAEHSLRQPSPEPQPVSFFEDGRHDNGTSIGSRDSCG
jgi:hypothetical protein